MNKNLNDAPEWAKEVSKFLDETEDAIKELSKNPEPNASEVEEKKPDTAPDVKSVMNQIMPGHQSNETDEKKLVDPVISNLVKNIM